MCTSVPSMAGAGCTLVQQRRRCKSGQQTEALGSEFNLREEVWGGPDGSAVVGPTASERRLVHMSNPWAPTLELKVQNRGLAVPPGVHLNCYGRFMAPEGAKSLRTFLPQVDMSIVHHMIMFGGKGEGVSTQPKARQLASLLSR